MPQLPSSQGQGEAVSAASAALKVVPAMGRLAATTCRGMPRMMNAELKAQCVHPVGKRLKTGTIGGGRETCSDRNEQAIFVPEILLLLNGSAVRLTHIPPRVDYRVPPAILLERSEDLRVGLELLFVDG